MNPEENNQLLRPKIEMPRLEGPIPRKPVAQVKSCPLIPPTRNENLHSTASLFQQSDDADTRSPAAKSSPRFPEAVKKGLSPRRHWWLWEILSATVSVAAMVSLLAILYHYNNTVVRHLSLGITFNGLVAVLSTVSRTSLMIPVASCCM